MDSHLFTSFENGFVRKINPESITDDTWILTDYDTKSPVVLISGREYLLKAGWIASQGLVYGDPFQRPSQSRNIHALYGGLPNVQSKIPSMSAMAYGMRGGGGGGSGLGGTGVMEIEKNLLQRSDDRDQM